MAKAYSAVNRTVEWEVYSIWARLNLQSGQWIINKMSYWLIDFYACQSGFLFSSAPYTISVRATIILWIATPIFHDWFLSACMEEHLLTQLMVLEFVLVPAQTAVMCGNFVTGHQALFQLGDVRFLQIFILLTVFKKTCHFKVRNESQFTEYRGRWAEPQLFDDYFNKK